MDGTLDVSAACACIDANAAAAYVARVLDADETRSIDAHIDTCPSCRRHLSALVASEDPAPLPGERVGRYVVEEKVGEGAMGVVYRAADPELGRAVALKMLRSSSGPVGEEARALGQVSHRNVVGVHDLLLERGRVFLALEWIDGISLTAWLRGVPRTVPEVLAAFAQAGRGLAAVHAAGVVHRDFKPDNVLVEHGGGRVCVTDFGLAYLGTGAAPSRAGTIAYMAPEQHRGAVVDAKSDQFAFCVALHEALHDAPPFAGDTASERRSAVLRGELRSLASRRRVPARVARAIRRGLAPDPAARHPTMEVLVATIAPTPTARRPTAVIALVAALVLAAGLLVAHRVGLPHASDRLVGVWNPARRSEIESAFLASGNVNAPAIWKETARSVDAYANGWSTLYEEARGGTGAPDGLVLRRRACLEDSLVELRALGDVLARADAAVVEHAVDAAQSLPSVLRCRDARLGPPPLPTDPAMRRRVLDVRDELAHARVARAAFAYADELRIAEHAVASARATGHGPLVAEALVEHGEASALAVSHASAELILREAVAAADASGADRMKASALLALFDVVRFEEKADLVAIAREEASAAVARLGGDDELEMRLDFATSSWRLDEGRPEDAEAPLRRSLALAESLHGPTSRLAATRLVLLAVCVGQLGDHAQALALHERTLPIFETTGLETPVTMFPHLGIAIELVELLRPAEAEPHARIAVRIAQRALGDEIAAYPLDQLGRALVDEGKLDEALEVFAAALANQEKVLGAHHSDIVDSTLGLGRARLSLAQPALAIPLLERALAIDSPSRRLERAEAAALLAEAFAATGGPRQHVIELAAGARAVFLARGAGPRHDRSLARVDAFLAAHR